MSFWEGIYFLTAMAALLLLTGRLRIVRNSLVPVRVIQLIFLAKVATGLVLSVLYEYYYKHSDIHRYLADGELLGQVFFTDPLSYFRLLFSVDMQDPGVQKLLAQLNHWSREHHYGMFNDNMTIVRFNALLYPLTGGNIAVHTAIANFLSLLGIVGLIRVFENRGVNDHRVLLTIFLFPELLLWSSGVLKEALLFMALGGFVFVFFQWINHSFSKRYLMVLVLSIALGLIIKPYVLWCLLPGSVMLVIHRIYPKLGIWRALLITFCLGVGSLAAIEYGLGVPLAEFIYQKQQDFLQLAPLSGSYFETFELQPNWGSLLIHAPEAFWNCLSRPMPWNTHNLISWIPAVENLLILTMLFMALIFPSKNRKQHLEILLFSALFVVSLFVVVGWVAPISGALVRYKIPALPFLLASLYLLIDWQRVGRLLLGKHLKGDQSKHIG